jgi:hypothetical protein
MLCKVSTEVDCDTLRREVSYDRQILEPRLIDRVKGAESRATQKRRGDLMVPKQGGRIYCG